jgi:hypothetical protein
MPYYPPPTGYYPSGLSVKNILIVTAVILALIVVMYLYASKQAKKKLKEQLPSEYADERYTTEESKKIRYYSSAIIADLDGFTFTHDLNLYRELLKESDRIFEGVCVDYRRLTGRTLRKDLNDEISFSNWSSYIKVRREMIARINMLQIP